MKTYLKIAFISYYSVTLLLCSYPKVKHTREQKPEVTISLDRSKHECPAVMIYAPNLNTHVGGVLLYKVSICQDDLRYVINNADIHGRPIGRGLFDTTRSPKSEYLQQIKSLMNITGIRDKNQFVINDDFFNKVSRTFPNEETENLSDIFSMYKIICIYAPSERGYLDNLLAPLSKEEQNALKLLNQEARNQAISSSIEPNISYNKSIKNRFWERYNAITHYWQSWTMPKLEKRHKWGLAGLGLALGAAGTYYLYKYKPYTIR
ncbi:MAG TPA: hypothetical protein VGW78_02840 [Candidatus Babeliales bacterium]|nr:hypothetical protein [Candidatus Babeliales bacterium]